MKMKLHLHIICPLIKFDLKSGHAMLEHYAV